MTEFAPSKPTLLIVDDQPVNIQALSNLLKSDYRVLVASNGAKALEIAGSENHPDLILLDIMMPDMDGYEVCRRLKSDKRTADIPVIFVTAKDSHDDEEKGLTLGAADYISKPYQPQIVRARVKTQTDRVQAIEQVKLAHERLSLAADAARFGTWDLDLLTHRMVWDDWMNNLYGIERGIYAGTYDTFIKRVHPDDLDRVVCEHESAIRGEKPLDTEFRIIKPDGGLRHLKANATVIRNGTLIPVRITGVNYDITTRKQYEQEITRYSQQLETQAVSLEELADQLSVMNQELDERVRQRTAEISHLLIVKTDLITQIGHDLKTPLTPLLALLPHIRTKVSDPELHELLDILIINARRMKQIVDNILHLASIEACKPEDLEGKTDVARIVDRVIRGEQYFIKQNNLTVKNRVTPDLIISMNETHCDLIVSNLINNAVKYSNPSGMVIVSAELTHDTVILLVEDNGQGIGAEHLPRIFEEFYKADSSRHDRDSTGIGLALVQRIVQSYGGTIRAESEGEGKGTTIRVLLPRRLMNDMHIFDHS